MAILRLLFKRLKLDWTEVVLAAVVLALVVFTLHQHRSMARLKASLQLQTHQTTQAQYNYRWLQETQRLADTALRDYWQQRDALQQQAQAGQTALWEEYLALRAPIVFPSVKKDPDHGVANLHPPPPATPTPVVDDGALAAVVLVHERLCAAYARAGGGGC